MAATDVDPSTYDALFEQFEVAMPLAALPSMLGRLGLLLGAIGLVRARTVPLWAALPLFVPAVLLGSTGGLPLAVGLPLLLGPMVLSLAFVARRVAITGGPALGASPTPRQAVPVLRPGRRVTGAASTGRRRSAAAQTSSSRRASTSVRSAASRARVSASSASSRSARSSATT
jgi:hypothetical protein